MKPYGIDRGQPARFARLVDRMLEPRHLHFVLQLHPSARALPSVGFVRQPDLDVAAAGAQRRSASQRAEGIAREVPARRMGRFDAHAEFFDQWPGDVEQRGGFGIRQRERGRVDQNQMVVRDAHVHWLHARPGRGAGFTAIGAQHVRSERCFVRCPFTACDGPELAGYPAFVRQGALEVLADHPLDQRGSRDQLVEGRTFDVVQRGGSVGCGGQREGEEEVKTVGVHDARHCMANDAGLSIPDVDREPWLIGCEPWITLAWPSRYRVADAKDQNTAVEFGRTLEDRGRHG